MRLGREVHYLAQYSPIGEPNGEVDYYCVLQNGAIDQEPDGCIGGDCWNPVEASTWSGIKALYR